MYGLGCRQRGGRGKESNCVKHACKDSGRALPPPAPRPASPPSRTVLSAVAAAVEGVAGVEDDEAAGGIP